MLTEQFLQDLEEKYHDLDLERIYSAKYIDMDIMKQNGKTKKLSIEGCTQAYLEDMYIELVQGVMFKDLNKDDMKVAIVPERFFGEICNGENHLNEIWNYFNGDQLITFRIVGVYMEDEYVMQQEETIKVYIPLEYSKLQGGVTEELSDTMWYRIESISDIEEMREQIINYYEQSYNNEDWTLNVKFNIDQRESINKYMQIAVYVITAIGGLTFVIGSMCIINMMIIMMDEKLVEVGIRRALGARKRDIYTEIIIEAIILVLFGTLFGVLLGCIGGYLMLLILSHMEEALIAVNYFAIPWSIIVGSVLVSFVVGIIAAVTPIIKVRKFTVCTILCQE